MRNPFNVEPDIVPDSDEEEFLEIKLDSSMKDFFQEQFYTEILVRTNISLSYNWEACSKNPSTFCFNLLKGVRLLYLVTNKKNKKLLGGGA